MRRTLAAKAAAATLALATVSVGGAYAAHDVATDESDATAVVNKNGHEVDEHAAHGQARAALARAQGGEPTGEPTEDATETPVEEPTEEPTEDGTEVPSEEPTEEPAKSQGPNAAAGDHPNERAYLKGANGNHYGQPKERPEPDAEPTEDDSAAPAPSAEAGAARDARGERGHRGSGPRGPQR